MKQKKNLIIVFHIYAIFASTNGDIRALFKRNENAEEPLCKDEESVFSKIEIYDISVCLQACVYNSGCKSVFHSQTTGRCTGCAASFEMSYQLGGLNESFRYYTQQECWEGWNYFANSCYIITERKMNFQNGLDLCHALNAYPVIVDSVEENNFLKAFIKSKYTHTADEYAYFTGFTDIVTEGTWVEHGTENQMVLKDWGGGDPGGGTVENCVVFYFPFDLKWVDISCNLELRIVCETDSFNIVKN
ncbi:CD209 antigen-like protein 2 [Ruditapes philippinarum]|uniref:CD209 antigen-like protein 2 n=1 Tax=Ruditapes philippinarum TaxID=129788 RepID=UPI00295B982C|nr:CD209 antigen-like protein 2 [Ruditapes philippinarum]